MSSKKNQTEMSNEDSDDDSTYEPEEEPTKGKNRKTASTKKSEKRKSKPERSGSSEEEEEVKEFYHLLQDGVFAQAISRLITEYVNNNPSFCSNIIINGHSNFLLVTLVCSTSLIKTVFYVDAANKNNANLTSKMFKIARDFLEPLGIQPAFHVTDGLCFLPDEGRVLDLVHLSIAFFKMFQADYIHTKQQILFVSRYVMAAAFSAERCKPLASFINNNGKVYDLIHGRGNNRFDSSVFDAVNERELLISIHESVCGPSGEDKLTAGEKFNHHREFVHRFMAIGRLLWRRLSLTDESSLVANALKLLQEIDLLLELTGGLNPICIKGVMVDEVYNSVVHTLKMYSGIFHKDKLVPMDVFFHVYDYQVLENADNRNLLLLEYYEGKSYGTGVGDRLDLWSGYSNVSVIYPRLGWTRHEVKDLLKNLR